MALEVRQGGIGHDLKVALDQHLADRERLRQLTPKETLLLFSTAGLIFGQFPLQLRAAVSQALTFPPGKGNAGNRKEAVKGNV